MKRPHNAKGNILFLILLAVVLFAALSYAVTSSMRGGGKDAGAESARTGAASILQYMALVRSEVQRLMLVNDCAYQNIDFRSNLYKRYDGSNVDSGMAAAVPKTGCAVFTAYGGAISPQTFEKYEAAGFSAYASVNSPNLWRAGHFAFRWANRINEGTSEPDIIMMLFGIAPDVCKPMMGLSPNEALPGDTWDYNTPARDAPPVITGANLIGDDPRNLYGDVFANAAINGGGTIPICIIGMTLIAR